VIKAKHDADSANSLWGAMSEIYAAKAIVETVDVDRLFDKSVARAIKRESTHAREGCREIPKGRPVHG